MSAEPENRLDAMTVGDAAAGGDNRDDAGGPTLTDVYCERGLAWSASDMFVGFVLAGVMAAVMVGVVGAGAHAVGIVAGVVLFGGGYWLYYRARTRHAKRRAHTLVDTLKEDADLRAPVCEMLDAVRGMSGVAGVRELATALIQSGRVGDALRIGRLDEFHPIRPIEFPFEPQPLNQAYAVLIEAASQSGESGSAADGSPSGRNDSSSTTARLVRRNVLTKGGWLLFGLFSAAFAINVLISLAEWRVTPNLLIYTLACVAFLFVPVRSQWRNQEWLVVPGGVVIRRSGMFASRWKLSLFEPRTSVLFVFRRWRSQWGAVMSDGQQTPHVVATQAECEFLLRTWLSPLSPPPVERLSDLS